MILPPRLSWLGLALIGLAALAGCAHAPGTRLTRRGDEIVVAGQFFHTGTPVVTWMDPGGYDAYRVERRFGPIADSGWDATKAQVKGMDTPNRYSMRRRDLTAEEIERVRGGGWDLPTLQRIVDQFVIHYDVTGVSSACFAELQDVRDLSVHFMLDLDGTIYQTLDLKERARHATIANDRSVGIEIANVGAYPPGDHKPLDEWYQRDAAGKPFIRVPDRLGDPRIRTKNFVARPLRPELVPGKVQGADWVQYDLTAQQYAALIKLTATLCKIFPQLKCDYPRGPDGAVLPHKLADDEWKNYHGILGHYHVQTNKIDPGPAFQWDKVIDGARALRGP
jgi:N-acetylmuramoyl-L-alanine amidase